MSVHALKAAAFSLLVVVGLLEATGASAETNTTHSDRAYLMFPGGQEVTAVEWLSKVSPPQQNEDNRCDGFHEPALCVWFVAGHVSIENPAGTEGPYAGWGCELHVGPILGDDHGLWHINHGQYCGDADDRTLEGVYEWRQETPATEWLRFRIERVDSYGYPGLYISLWRITVTWTGSQHVLSHGQFSFGDRIDRVVLFVEVIEDDPCHTDFTQARFLAPRYWTVEGGPFSFTGVDIQYEGEGQDEDPENACPNTRMVAPFGNASYVIDTRETQRH